FRNGRAQAYGQVVREMISADGNRGSVAYHAATVHHQLGGAAANIEQAAAQFALVLGQAGSAEARGSSTVSATTTPARFTAVIRFCVAVAEPVTICTLTSRRCPTIPTGSRILSWASTTNSCGSTCSTSRSSASVISRAASTA